MSTTARALDGVAIHYEVQGERAPTAVLVHGWGFADRFPTQADAMLRYLRDFDYAVVEGTGHYLMLENPERLAELLERAVGEVARGEEQIVGGVSILWRRLDQPGHESARLASQDSSWRLTGTAVFAHDGRPCGLDYVVVCDPEWRTVSARVAGWVGVETIRVELSVDSARRWRLNGTECPEVAGCIDLDLNFSPSTNLLPIRRLGLAVGKGAEVRAAWLRFPSFTLEPLDQRYRRTHVGTYRYESAGGTFVTDLDVNSAGFVTRYPGFWQSEVVTGAADPEKSA